MRKLLWIGGILAGVVVVILLGLTLFVKSYLQSERLKALIIPRIEAYTGRKVTISDIQMSLFKGIVIKGISIKQQDGVKDFIRTEAFILDYSLLPLLKRQLVINNIELDTPSIVLRREKDGRYNFSDLTARMGQKEEKEVEREQREQELLVSIFTNKIIIRNATAEFTDALNKLPHIVALVPKTELTASLGRETKGLVLSGTADLKSVTATMGSLQTVTSGRIEIKERAIIVALTTVLGKDIIRTSGAIKEYRTAPDLQLNFSAKELDLERLMALTAGAKPVPLPAQASSDAAEERPHRGFVVLAKDARQSEEKMIKAAGELKVDTAHYKGYILKDVLAGYRYRNNVMIIDPVRMRITGGTQVSADGTVQGNLVFTLAQGGGDAAAAIKKTLSGVGDVALNRVAVRQTPLTDAVARFTGIPELRSPRFDRGTFNFKIRDQKVVLEGMLDSSHLKVVPSGTVGFNKSIDMLADLRLSPGLTDKLERDAKVTGYLRDREGWTTIPLRISGTTEKPSVSLNPAAVQKQLRKGIQSELERRLMRELAPKDKKDKEKAQPPSKGPRPEELLRELFGK